MKIVHVHFDYETSIKTERQLLEKYYTVTGWAEALQKKGAEVIVINRFHKDSFLEENNVQYYFIHDSLPPKLRAWHLPLKLFQKIKALDAHVIHLHHLSLASQNYILRKLLKTKTAVVIQHHGGPSPGRIRAFIYSMLNRVTDGYFFVDAEQGKEWFIGKQRSKVMSIMEGATFFNFLTRDAERTFVYSNRDKVRIETGMDGDPVFLWVGNLVSGKDPLTVLNGFKNLFKKWPGGKLFMVYQKEDLLMAVEQKI